MDLEEGSTRSISATRAKEGSSTVFDLRSGKLSWDNYIGRNPKLIFQRTSRLPFVNFQDLNKLARRKGSRRWPQRSPVRCRCRRGGERGLTGSGAGQAAQKPWILDCKWMQGLCDGSSSLMSGRRQRGCRFEIQNVRDAEDPKGHSLEEGAVGFFTLQKSIPHHMHPPKYLPHVTGASASASCESVPEFLFVAAPLARSGITAL